MSKIVTSTKPPYLCTEIWRGTNPPEPKNGDFLHLQLSNWFHPGGCIVYVKGILLTSLLGKPMVQMIMTWKWAKQVFIPIPTNYTFVKRCPRNHYIKFGELTSKSYKTVIFYTPSCKSEVGGHIVILWGFPLIHAAVPFSISVLSRPPHPLKMQF